MTSYKRCNLFLIGLVFTLILGMLPYQSQFSIIIISSQEREQLVSISTSDYAVHAPILIESNSDFETQGWPGNGSISNPYMISGLNITANEDLIQIHYTSVFYEIRDCYLASNTSWNDCISLRFAGNGLIENCILMTQFNGIILYESDNIVLQDCIISSQRGPIRAMYSNGFRVSNCTFPDLELLAFPLRFTLDHCFNAVINSSEFHKVCISIQGSTSSITSCNFTEGGLLNYWPLTSEFYEFSNNYVNGKPILLLNGNDSLVLEADDYGQIILFDCSNILVQNGNMSNTRPVQLSNCVGCKIQNITSWFGYSAIYDYMSNYTTIQNCTFHGVFSGGVFMTRCSHSIVENCHSYFDDQFFSSSTMIVQSCINTTVAKCTIENNRNEAMRISGTNMRLSDCQIYGARYGILAYGNNMTIDNNHVYDTSSENVHPFFSTGISATLTNSTISNNLIENGDDFGINIFSNDSLFVNNTISGNAGIGIELLNGSNGNVLYSNTLSLNSKGNALDNGFSNQWDDGVSIGNTWDDFNPLTETDYPIPGIAGSVDRFPMNSTTFTPTVSITDSITDSTNTTTSQTSIDNEITWITIIIATSGLVIIVIVIIIKKR